MSPRLYRPMVRLASPPYHLSWTSSSRLTCPNDRLSGAFEQRAALAHQNVADLAFIVKRSDLRRNLGGPGENQSLERRSDRRPPLADSLSFDQPRLAGFTFELAELRSEDHVCRARLRIDRALLKSPVLVKQAVRGVGVHAVALHHQQTRLLPARHRGPVDAAPAGVGGKSHQSVHAILLVAVAWFLRLSLSSACNPHPCGLRRRGRTREIFRTPPSRRKHFFAREFAARIQDIRKRQDAVPMLVHDPEGAAPHL